MGLNNSHFFPTNIISLRDFIFPIFFYRYLTPMGFYLSIIFYQYYNPTGFNKNDKNFK